MTGNAPERRRAEGCLLGLACGDALGRPVEFQSADQIEDRHGEVTEMLGYGTHGQPAGTITEDTEIAQCIAESLVECRGFDGTDVAAQFVEWYVFFGLLEPSEFSYEEDGVGGLIDETEWDDLNGMLDTSDYAPLKAYRPYSRKIQFDSRRQWYESLSQMTSKSLWRSTDRRPSRGGN